MDTTKVGPVQEAEVVSYKPEDFAKEYEALCTKMGYRVVTSPQWIATNHGSFEMVLQYTVGKISTESKK